MEERQFIRFFSGTGDLRPSKESWSGASFTSRKEEIYRYYYRYFKAYPRKSMDIIKRGVIDIRKDTTLDDLQQLATLIERDYNISCFQIAIYRSNHEAHMLFDCFDRVSKSNYRIHTTQMKHLYVLIIETLNLSVPMKDMIPLMRYYLYYIFKKDKNVFRNRLDVLKHLDLTPKAYRDEAIIHYYIEEVLRGRMK